MLSSSHALNHGCKPACASRGREIRAEAGEDLHPAGGAVEEILIGSRFASAYMDVGIQKAGTAPTSTPRKPAAATPTTVMG